MIIDLKDEPKLRKLMDKAEIQQTAVASADIYDVTQPGSVVRHYYVYLVRYTLYHLCDIITLYCRGVFFISIHVDSIRIKASVYRPLFQISEISAQYMFVTSGNKTTNYIVSFTQYIE